MSVLEMAKEYGGWVFALALLVDRVFPVLPAILNRIIPPLQRRQQAEDARAEKELDARIKREAADQEHRFDVENRSVRAMEMMAEAIKGINGFMRTLDDRMAGLEVSHRDIAHRPVPRRKSRVRS